MTPALPICLLHTFAGLALAHPAKHDHATPSATLIDTAEIAQDWATGPNAEWPATELSGIDNLGQGWFAVVSDERGTDHPVRFGFVRLRLTTNDEGTLEFLAPGKVNWIGVRTDDWQPAQPNTMDLESIRVIDNTPRERSFLVASEGYGRGGIGPALYRTDATGKLTPLEDTVPDHFMPEDESGIKHNRGFESLTVLDEGNRAIVATEEPLRQDRKPKDADPFIRLLEINLTTDTLTREIRYPITEPKDIEDIKGHGLVELLALPTGDLLALERTETRDGDFHNQLILVTLPKSSASDADTVAKKQHLASLADLGIEPANYEGMTLGPRTPTGEITVLFVSDNDGNKGEPTRLALVQINNLVETEADR